MVVDGFTVIAELVLPPGIQLYVEAPEPVRVAVAPEQIADEEPTALTVGVMLTVMLTVFVLVQPELVPVTV